MRLLSLLLPILAVWASVDVSPGLAQDQPDLLIIGTPHFVNQGGHVIDTTVPDVTINGRQQEIEAIVARLATYRPTHIAVEWDAGEQATLDQRYESYRAGRLVLTANERDQIGLRLAARLGLPKVHAVDWGDEPPGGWSHYNYPEWAERNNRGMEWRARTEMDQEESDAEVRLMACTPISSWLRRMNTREARLADHRRYYMVAQVGDLVGANPGSAWVGNWYNRNLRILNNLRSIAPQGSRVLVLYGAGHGHLLDQQARESGDFSLSDPLSYLPASDHDGISLCPDPAT